MSSFLELIQECSIQATRYLQIPAWTEYQESLQAAVMDSYQALSSTCQLFFLTCRPLLLLVYYTVYQLLIFLWEYVIVQGLYEHGLSQTKDGLVAFWKFQQSLTGEQLLGEAVLLLSSVGVYKLWQFWKRQTYYRRFVVWYDHKRQQNIKCYRQGVDQIASFSLLLAIMTPHTIFLSVAVGIKLFVPRVITYLATRTAITAVLSKWYPVPATILLLYEVSNDKKDKTSPKDKKSIDKENKGTPSKSKKPRTRSSRQPLASNNQGFFPRTTPTTHRQRRRRRSTLQSPLRAILHESEQSLEEQEVFWLQYWMVYAALQALKRLVVLTPILGRLVVTEHTKAWLLQLEMLFYLWIYIIPHMLPAPTTTGRRRPEGRPLPLSTKRLGPAALFCHERISSAISLDFWQYYVVDKVSHLCNGLVFIKIFSQPFADWIVHIAEEGRSFVVPGITLLMPGFVTAYGVVYVQYILPLAKSASAATACRVQQLRYWVLHTIAATVLSLLPGVLWWLPFSTHAVMIFWCWLSLPQTTEKWYPALEEDLQAFGLLPGDPLKPVHETRTARAFQSLLEKLPSAQEEEEIVAQEETSESNEAEPIEQPTKEAIVQHEVDFVEHDDALTNHVDPGEVEDDGDWVLKEDAPQRRS